MVVVLIIVAAVVAWYFLGNHDTKATKEALKLKERNADQKKVIRYFLNNGCVSKHISDQEYQKMLDRRLAQFDFRKMALDKIGLDESELQEIAAVTFHDWLVDKTTYGRQGKDYKWRYSGYQVSWLFFSSTQVYLYQYTLYMDCDEKKEVTNEYFYKDITSFNTSSDTVEVRYYDTKKKKDVLKNVDATRFCLVVPGDKMYCAMQQTPESERAVQAMKTKLREKKNA